ncbi:MAG: toll/interleukin-1 receptor domain-containing protein [Deltaproteobacteria bacterium]|nr:toll/interleukin-1 receptor domain-containing protein [Deltaproteobacteria bacterium]
MNENYPIPAQTLIQTLDELFSHLGEEEIAGLLRQAEASINWEGQDNWDGGRDFYCLNLKIPVPAFASIDSKRAAVENALLQKVGAVTRQFDRDVISRVIIVPDVRVTGAPGAGQLSPDILRRIWEGDGLRLFITHRAQDKLAAVELKTKVAPYGVSGFVAHQDIEPNQVWQSEIERALVSMHALVAMIIPGFDSSVWCHQEIGFALGRGVPVIPLRLGADPHGFIGRIQALNGDLSNIQGLASNLVDTLLKADQTSAMMREHLVLEFEHAKTWETARLLRPKLLTVTRFDGGQLTRIEKALTENQKVATAYGVPEAVNEFLAKQRRSISRST